MNQPRKYAEAAAWLGISESTLRKAVAAGKVPHSKPFGRQVLFTDEHLEAILANGEVRPRPAPVPGEATVTDIRKGKSTVRRKGRAA